MLHEKFHTGFIYFFLITRKINSTALYISRNKQQPLSVTSFLIPIVRQISETLECHVVCDLGKMKVRQLSRSFKMVGCQRVYID